MTPGDLMESHFLLDYTCRARWPRRCFCAGEPQKSCPSVRSSVTTPHTSARKSMANQPNPGLSRKGILFDHRFASFKAVLHFLVSQNVSFLRCVPFWTPFLITFLLPSKQYCTFQGPNMAQHKLSKIAQNSVTATTNDERTDRRTSDF